MLKVTLEYDLNWGSSHKSSQVENEHGAISSSPVDCRINGDRKQEEIAGKHHSIPPMGYSQIRLFDGEASVP